MKPRIAECVLIAVLPVAIHAATLGPASDVFATPAATIDIPGVGLTAFTGLPLATNPLFPLPPVLPYGFYNLTLQWVDPLANQVGAAWVDTLSSPHFFPPAGADTVVERTAGFAVRDVGGTADVPIEIGWLSLKSAAPVFLSPFGPVDVYVGLDSAPQTPGRMRLISTAPGGYHGLADLGRVGVTSDNPSDPAFLGLPVTYDVVFIPAGLPETSTPVQRLNGLESVLHSAPGTGPGGLYNISPEPSALLLAGSGVLLLIGIKRKFSAKF